MKHTKPLEHLVIYTDGNTRWAKEHGVAQLEGYMKGLERSKEIVEACEGYGVKYLTVNVMSEDSLGRSEGEQGAFLGALSYFYNYFCQYSVGRGYRMRFLANREKCPEEFRELLDRVERETAGGERLTLIFTAGYSGRGDIMDAVRGIIRDGVKEVNEEVFRGYLGTAGVPEPDLMIRPGREKRLSNCLLWEMAYTELYFTDVLWPDFGVKELEEAFREYERRDRRHGKATEHR